MPFILFFSSDEIAQWMIDNKVLLCGYDVPLDKAVIKKHIDDNDGKCATEVIKRYNLFANNLYIKGR